MFRKVSKNISYLMFLLSALCLYDFVRALSGYNEMVVHIAFPVLFFIQLGFILFTSLYLFNCFFICCKQRKWSTIIVYFSGIVLFCSCLFFLQIHYKNKSIIKANQQFREYLLHHAIDYDQIELEAAVFLHKRYDFQVTNHGQKVRYTLYNDVYPYEIVVR